MFKWFRRAAHQTDLGPGFAERPDYDHAVKWFRKAAEKGTSWGQFNLGISYGRGQGVPQDYAEAIKWFLKAAEQNEAISQYNLGRMYEKGLGVVADDVEAYKWFELAAGHGIADAEKARDQLRRRLTPEQIAEGQHRAAAFAPKKAFEDHH
jgi:TPR repeat protein